MAFVDMLSVLASLGYAQGTTDLLAIVRDSPIETNITANAADIRPQDILAVKKFAVQITQKSASEERYAGEGPDSSMIFVQQSKIRATAEMPLYAPSTGWIDPAFAALYDLTRWAYWGVAIAAVGGLTTAVSPGATALITDNISEFADLSAPFNIILGIAPETAEIVLVESINKSTRTLTLSGSTPVVNHHGVPSQISAYSTSLGSPNQFQPSREPAFSLLSYIDGMVSPTLVNKITIDANIGEPVKVSIEFCSLGVERDRQIEMYTLYDTILASLSQLPPVRVIDSVSVTLSPTSSNSASFGLLSAIGDPLFGGFKGLAIQTPTVEGFSITIDNNLNEVYSLYSRSSGGKRIRENVYPYALVSNGRKVYGQIKMRTTLSSFATAERLAGPSALADGGLLIDYGAFTIALPELAWTPTSDTEEASSDNVRTLEWSLVADGRNALPELGFSTQNGGNMGVNTGSSSSGSSSSNSSSSSSSS